MVGDEVVLRCAASYDPMLDIAFIWAIDLRVIDFDAEWQHYERVLVGWQFILQSYPFPFSFPASFHLLVFASCYSEWRRQRWPENNERTDLAWRSLHLHGSDGGGQWHRICWSQGCRSVPSSLSQKIIDAKIKFDSWTSELQVIGTSFVIFKNYWDPGVPGPPGVIRVDEIGDTWVKLLWSKPADHNSPILSYTIQTRHFWALNEDDWRDASTCKCCFLPVGVQVDLQFGITGASGLLQPTSKNVLTQYNSTWYLCLPQLQLFLTAVWRRQKWQTCTPGWSISSGSLPPTSTALERPASPPWRSKPGMLVGEDTNIWHF